MTVTTAIAAIGNGLDRAVAAARRRPRRVLAALLGFHLIVWSALPMLLSWNLQLDLAEDLALGKEWQLGYWKHPPLPWWIADLAYRLVGHVDAVYLLGPLATVVCFWGVWLLARELVGAFRALIAVLALEGIHYYNFSAVKFAHDQMQLPFWALTGFFLWRALARERKVDWIWTGLCLAGAFWSKYAVFALAATLGLFLLYDPVARRTWRGAGPYLMALTFAVAVIPNLWWVIAHDFLPLRYVEARAVADARWFEYVVSPLQWSAGQLLFLAPAIVLLGLLFPPASLHVEPPSDANAAFARRYVTVLATGPFLFTTFVAAALGRLPVAMWGYPLWSFAPLAVLLWLAPPADPTRLRHFFAGALVLLAAMPLAYAAIEVGEPLLRDREKADQFPGRLLATRITALWRAQTGTPLAYVGGAVITAVRHGRQRLVGGASEFAANLVAVYSPDRPHVVVHGELRLSPWIDPRDLERKGIVLIWQGPRALPDNLRIAFPRAELQPPLVLPSPVSAAMHPIIVHFALVRPRP